MTAQDAFTDLRELIMLVSQAAGTLFKKHGRITPTYHAIDANGAITIFEPPSYGDKDLELAIVHAWMVLQNIDRYVFIDEAWCVKGADAIDEARIKREGAARHPDRREIVMFVAENRKGEIVTARRYILRPEHGRAKLMPLAIDDMSKITKSGGRMTGLLRED